MTKNGKVYDPYTGREILRNDSWQFGHRPEFKFSDWQQRAAREGWSKELRNDFLNAPSVYRVETRFNNEGHFIELLDY